MKRGKAMQLMTYPRPEEKAAIVDYVNSIGVRMSGFIISAAIEKIAVATGQRVEDIISKSTAMERRRKRGRKPGGRG
jgi:hypothetical protein